MLTLERAQKSSSNFINLNETSVYTVLCWALHLKELQTFYTTDRLHVIQILIGSSLIPPDVGRNPHPIVKVISFTLQWLSAKSLKQKYGLRRKKELKSLRHRLLPWVPVFYYFIVCRLIPLINDVPLILCTGMVTVT